MIKLNSVIYNKLLCQANLVKEENKELSDSILKAIGAASTDEPINYSYENLENDVNSNLWKIATDVIVHYNVKSADIEELDSILKSFAENLIDKLEENLKVKKSIEKVMGEI